MELKRHFLQSEEWEGFQRELRKEVWRRSGEEWEFMAVREKTAIGDYLYVPYGPSFVDEESAREAFRELKKLAGEAGAFFVRVEPVKGVSAGVLREMGFRKIKEVNPEFTWCVDLAGTEEEILMGMKQNNRNLWRGYERKGLKVRKSTGVEDLKYLTTLLRGVAKNNGVNLHDEEYLRKQMEAGIGVLYLAEFAGEVVAASMVYDLEGVRYYAHAAADFEHRKLSAGTVLVVEMMMDAKRSGMREFDFYGVTVSEDPGHDWYGFTKFKKGFGGSLREYLGTWDLPINRVKYAGFKRLRAVNRAVRKIRARR
ncbi:peptidoglycan bridge formation glycyltransferase FemA/FemB family protein [Candidatus Saccharibacteria bacterium]|nr:peptidoglycan bridge formation glycyltransferase FemA/FemB family protein [Candidatus Saccharibacteria bacterium]